MRNTCSGIYSGAMGTFEPLELRRMLAGDVTAATVGDVLVIHGDNESNAIILSTHPDNTTTVAPAAGTTVNGAGTATFAGFPDVSCDMGNGDDNVAMIDMFQTATIVTGNGNDTVTGDIGVFPPNVFFDLSINTGNGDDLAHLGGFTGVFFELEILTGDGADVVEIVDATAVEGDRLYINTGNGADVIRLADEFFVPGSIIADGGHLDDSSAFGLIGALVYVNIETIIH
jgi:hypothetical protein